jgi:hypothetical protein
VWYQEGQVWKDGGFYLVESCQYGVSVSFYVKGERFPLSTTWFDTQGSPWIGVRSKASMVSKYIQAVRAAAGKVQKGERSLDPVIGDKRPALTAFMTDSDAGGGKVRELSALMMAVGDDGLRVGLKDDDMGGWCWRSGATLADALDALETALASGEARFGGAKGRGGKKGR